MFTLILVGIVGVLVVAGSQPDQPAYNQPKITRCAQISGKTVCRNIIVIENQPTIERD